MESLTSATKSSTVLLKHKISNLFDKSEHSTKLLDDVSVDDGDTFASASDFRRPANAASHRRMVDDKRYKSKPSITSASLDVSSKHSTSTSTSSSTTNVGHVPSTDHLGRVLRRTRTPAARPAGSSSRPSSKSDSVPNSTSNNSGPMKEKRSSKPSSTKVREPSTLVSHASSHSTSSASSTQATIPVVPPPHVYSKSPKRESSDSRTLKSVSRSKSSNHPTTPSSPSRSFSTHSARKDDIASPQQSSRRKTLKSAASASQIQSKSKNSQSDTVVKLPTRSKSSCNDEFLGSPTRSSRSYKDDITFLPLDLGSQHGKLCEGNAPPSPPRYSKSINVARDKNTTPDTGSKLPVRTKSAKPSLATVAPADNDSRRAARRLSAGFPGPGHDEPPADPDKSASARRAPRRLSCDLAGSNATTTPSQSLTENNGFPGAPDANGAADDDCHENKQMELDTCWIDDEDGDGNTISHIELNINHLVDDLARQQQQQQQQQDSKIPETNNAKAVTDKKFSRRNKPAKVK